MGTLVGTKIAGEVVEARGWVGSSSSAVRVIEVSVPFLPVVTSSAPMRCHLACLDVEEPQVGWPHWCHLPRFSTPAVPGHVSRHLAKRYLLPGTRWISSGALGWEQCGDQGLSHETAVTVR